MLSATLSLLLLFSATSSVASLLPKVEDSYFNAEDYTECLAELIAVDHKSLPRLNDALSAIEKRRESLSSSATTDEKCQGATATVCEMFGVNPSGKDLSAFQSLGCYLNKKIEKGLWYHSSALIDCSTHEVAEVPYMWRLNLYQSAEENKELNLNDDTDIAGKLESSKEGIGTTDEQRKCVSDKAEPLVKWLIAQKKNSVSHWQLLKQAHTIYGYTFTALGVIGEIFDEERLSCPSRQKSCVLNNRLKPLMPSDTQDKVGHNYHFWSHISMVLRESAVSESLANYLFEWHKDRDVGDYSANRFGIKISSGAIKRAKSNLRKNGKFNCKM